MTDDAGVDLTVDVPLPVRGVLPPSLGGTLVRIGPDATSSEAFHASDAAGIVHAVTLRDGSAVAYRRRRVEPRSGAGPERAGARPNAHVLDHAGALLALADHGLPHRLDARLRGHGPDDLDGALPDPMASHAKRDPDTGELVVFGYDPAEPCTLRLRTLRPDGSLARAVDVELDRPVAVHDFAVTATRIVVFDLPRLLAPDGSTTWSPELGARVGTLARSGPGDVAWTPLLPRPLHHVANAFDEGDAVVLDVCRAGADDPSAPAPAAPTLARWRVDPASGRVEERRIDDRLVDLPRVDDVVAGRAHRFAYGLELRTAADGDVVGAGLLKYDLARDEVERFDPGGRRMPGEPVFVRDAEGRTDEEGWVLSVVHDAESDRSELVVLDATAFTAAPVAVVSLPARLPTGFHGSWIVEGDVAADGEITARREDR